MAKQKKQPRPKAETPKGFRDYFGAEVTERNRMLAQIAEVYDRYGFDPLETSAVETVEALGKFLPRRGPAQRGGSSRFRRTGARRTARGWRCATT